MLVCGVAASILCFNAGDQLLAVQSESYTRGEGRTLVEMISHGVGVYCVGMGFFVGPLLIGIGVVAGRIGNNRQSACSGSAGWQGPIVVNRVPLALPVPRRDFRDMAHRTMSPTGEAISQRNRHGSRSAFIRVRPQHAGKSAGPQHWHSQWHADSLRLVSAASPGLTDVRPHDLRRCLGSWMAISGGSLPRDRQDVGPRRPAPRGYARLSVDPIRQAAETALAQC